MSKIRVAAFSGEIPRASPTLMPASNARVAENGRLYSGELGYYRGPLTVSASPVDFPQTIYKLHPASGSAAGPIWLAWTTDVDVVSGQLADTTDGRVYYTGDGVPKKTNYLMVNSSGASNSAWLHMGVAAPTTAPTVASSNTSTASTYEDRVYIYTYVSTFGAVIEESAPSPPSAQVTFASGATGTISGFAAPPTAGYNITGIRVYRAVTGTSGAATYLQVAELDFAAGAAPPASYTDNVSAVALGSALETLGWREPPANMTGITNLPNGIMAGFAGNTVYFCVPYYHHAWPEGYGQSFPHNIVGLAVWGQTLVVVTDGIPYLIAGTHPAAMTIQQIPLPQPGVSKRSIVGTEYGAIYASPEGIVQIGYIKQDLVSQEYFHRDEWQAVNPSTLNSVMYDNQYMGFFKDSSARGDGALMFAPADKPGLAFLTQWYSAIYVDAVDRSLYFYDSVSQTIRQFDAEPSTYVPYTWKSKRFYLAKDTTLSAVKIDYYADAPISATYNAIVVAVDAQNAADISAGLSSNALGSHPLAATARTVSLKGISYMLGGALGSSATIPKPSLSGVQYLTFTLYDETDTEVTSFSLSSTQPYRIPPARSRAFTFQLYGTVAVTEVQLATSVKELLAP